MTVKFYDIGEKLKAVKRTIFECSWLWIEIDLLSLKWNEVELFEFIEIESNLIVEME